MQILDNGATQFQSYSNRQLLIEAALFENASCMEPYVRLREGCFSDTNAATVLEKAFAMLASGIAISLREYGGFRRQDLWYSLSEFAHFCQFNSMLDISELEERHIYPSRKYTDRGDETRSFAFTDFASPSSQLTLDSS
jgi:hypothetical protein